MTEEQLKDRTKAFSLRIIKLVDSLPRSQAGRILANQLIRAGTSVGANYRAACRARSHAEFVSKLGIVQEEADESLYWMELITESGLIRKGRLAAIMAEAGELVAIFTASLRTAKRSPQLQHLPKIKNQKSKI